MADNVLKLAIEAAKAAGAFLLDNFGKVSSIEKKGDRNFATNVDRGAEKLIIDTIKQTFPAHAILAEESGNSGRESDYIWIIDPLDGTHNFIRDIDIFGVSIGLVYKESFAAGVIYMPREGELYTAEAGGGAYKNGTKISVSSQDDLRECSISFDSSIRYSPEVMLKALDALARKVFNIRMFGSSARVLSYIAEGKLDFAVEFHDRPWDFAGGVCIIREAGGRLTTLGGQPLAYQNIGYIASNATVHDKVVEIIKRETGI
jgi:myo-inositol-1(or 4)-monophosphatase